MSSSPTNKRGRRVSRPHHLSQGQEKEIQSPKKRSTRLSASTPTAQDARSPKAGKPEAQVEEDTPAATLQTGKGRRSLGRMMTKATPGKSRASGDSKSDSFEKNEVMATTALAGEKDKGIVSASSSPVKGKKPSARASDEQAPVAEADVTAKAGRPKSNLASPSKTNTHMTSPSVRRSGRAVVPSSRFKDMEVELGSRKRSAANVSEDSEAEAEPVKKRGRKGSVKSKQTSSVMEISAASEKGALLKTHLVSDSEDSSAEQKLPTIATEQLQKEKEVVEMILQSSAVQQASTAQETTVTQVEANAAGEKVPETIGEMLQSQLENLEKEEEEEPAAVGADTVQVTGMEETVETHPRADEEGEAVVKEELTDMALAVLDIAKPEVKSEEAVAVVEDAHGQAVGVPVVLSSPKQVLQSNQAPSGGSERVVLAGKGGRTLTMLVPRPTKAGIQLAQTDIESQNRLVVSKTTGPALTQQHGFIVTSQSSKTPPQFPAVVMAQGSTQLNTSFESGNVTSILKESAQGLKGVGEKMASGDKFLPRVLVKSPASAAGPVQSPSGVILNTVGSTQTYSLLSPHTASKSVVIKEGEGAIKEGPVEHVLPPPKKPMLHGSIRPPKSKTAQKVVMLNQLPPKDKIQEAEKSSKKVEIVIIPQQVATPTGKKEAAPAPSEGNPIVVRISKNNESVVENISTPLKGESAASAVADILVKHLKNQQSQRKVIIKEAVNADRLVQTSVTDRGATVTALIGPNPEVETSNRQGLSLKVDNIEVDSKVMDPSSTDETKPTTTAAQSNESLTIESLIKQTQKPQTPIHASAPSDRVTTDNILEGQAVFNVDRVSSIETTTEPTSQLQAEEVSTLAAVPHVETGGEVSTSVTLVSDSQMDGSGEAMHVEVVEAETSSSAPEAQAPVNLSETDKSGDVQTLVATEVVPHVPSLTEEGVTSEASQEVSSLAAQEVSSESVHDISSMTVQEVSSLATQGFSSELSQNEETVTSLTSQHISSDVVQEVSAGTDQSVSSDNALSLTELTAVSQESLSHSPQRKAKKIKLMDNGVVYEFIVEGDAADGKTALIPLQNPLKEKHPEDVEEDGVIIKEEVVEDLPDETSEHSSGKQSSGTQTAYVSKDSVKEEDTIHKLATVVSEGGQKRHYYYVSVVPGKGISGKYKSSVEQSLPGCMLNEQGMYCCAQCDYRTDKKANFYKHRRLHTGTKPHTCLVCNYKAGTSSNLKRHMGIHKDIRQYKCDICGLSFRQKIHLERHIKYKHEEKSVHCPLCDYVCANEQPDLKMHMKRRHSTETAGEILTCPECDAKVSSKKDLKQHLKFHRDGPELKLFCKECSFVTDCQSRLRRHAAIHSKDKPFQCGICAYKATQKEHVLRHLRTQHKIEVKKEKRSWKRHTKPEPDGESQDGLKERGDFTSGDKIFACNHCTMRFAKLINLYKHLHTQHSDIMPGETEGHYYCVVCEFSTISKKNLLVHMRRHNITDQTPPTHVYSCVLCRYVNPRRRNLFQHMRKKHNIDIGPQVEPGVAEEEQAAEMEVAEIVKTDQKESPAVSIGTATVTVSDGGENLRVMGDDLAGVANMIKIEDLTRVQTEVDGELNERSLVIDTRGSSGSQGVHVLQGSGTTLRHEAADAIEGLQALAEQAGLIDNIIEEQVPVLDEQQTVVIEQPDGTTQTATTTLSDGSIIISANNDITPDPTIVGEIQQPEIGASEAGAGGLELTEDQLSSLQNGDMVEIDGEVYVVELTQDPENANKQLLSFLSFNNA